MVELGFCIAFLEAAKDPRGLFKMLLLSINLPVTPAPQLKSVKFIRHHHPSQHFMVLEPVLFRRLETCILNILLTHLLL